MNPRLRKRLAEVNRQLARRAPVTHRELYEVLASEVAFRYGEVLPPYLTDLSKEGLERWLAHFDIRDPTEVGSVGKYYLLSQAKALVAKYRYPIPGLDALAEGRAYEKFLASEQKCKVVNEQFSAASLCPVSNDEMQRLRGFIAYALGDVPSYSELSSELAFGPGAALGTHGPDTSSYRKLLAGKWSVSSASRDYARVFAHTHPQLLEVLVDPEKYLLDEGEFYSSFEKQVDVVDHNTVLFVPKTTLTRRSIAIEPLLNNWLQTAVDVAMRRRLRAVGNDLKDQSRNQRMAWEGSFDSDDGFCTIDLSSASDSISIEVVRQLLPGDWFYLLDRLRSKSFKYGDQVHRYEKFCSMGNGFCFPLQTILFLAVAATCASGRVSEDFRVYGDDIIVRKSAFPAVTDLLGRLGFTLNLKKTFSSGVFRESCGGDYWQGVDVRPAEMESIGSLPDFFIFHNLLRRSDMCQRYMSSVQQYLFETVPEDVRFVIPLAKEAAWLPGDMPKRSRDLGHQKEVAMGGFALEMHDEAFLTSPHVRRNADIQGWEFKELTTRPVHKAWDYGQDPRRVGAAILYAALSGSSPYGYNYLRRTTRTNVCWRAHG